MRTDCRHYESRTYGNGEVVRKCRLDLAPEAPWRCPADCVGYERRRIDAGWHYGTLTTANEAPDVEPVGDDIAALLDAAEEIVNSAAPGILSDFDTSKRGLLGRKKSAGKSKKKKKR